MGIKKVSSKNASSKTLKPSKSKADNPTYLEMIKTAINLLNEPKGSSRPAIKKHLLQNFRLKEDYNFVRGLNSALARGLEAKVLYNPNFAKGSFKVYTDKSTKGKVSKKPVDTLSSTLKAKTKVASVKNSSKSASVPTNKSSGQKAATNNRSVPKQPAKTAGKITKASTKTATNGTQSAKTQHKKIEKGKSPDKKISPKTEKRNRSKAPQSKKTEKPKNTAKK